MNDDVIPSAKMSVGDAISILIVMAIIVFTLFIYRKNARVPKFLFISSLISYVLILVNILQVSLRIVEFPIIIGVLCFVAVLGSNTPALYIFWNSEIVFYLVAFIIDTLIIFTIIRLILYDKYGLK